MVNILWLHLQSFFYQQPSQFIALKEPRFFGKIECMEIKIRICSFCNMHVDYVAKLVVASKSAICNECVELCSKLIEDDTKPNQINK